MTPTSGLAAMRPRKNATMVSTEYLSRAHAVRKAAAVMGASCAQQPQFAKQQ
jgi:hypothetical protein